MPFAKLFHATTEADMPGIAADIAAHLAPGMLVALEGNLGAGKSTLARALIRHLAADPALDVPSPTFTLVQTYDTPAMPVWHFDFYRLKSPDEIFELGWEDALASKALLLMEWAERIGPYLPQNTLHIVITPTTDGGRDVFVHDRDYLQGARA